MEAKRLSLINPPKIKNLSYVVGNEPRSVTVLFVPRLRISQCLKNYFLVKFSTGCVILINNIKWYIFPLKSLKIMFSDLSLVIYIPYIFFQMRYLVFNGKANENMCAFQAGTHINCNDILFS